MKKSFEKKILGTIAAADFIGRDHELDLVTAHALNGKSSGLLVLATPGAGASELLRQAYDRLFRDQNEIIPFYFAARSSDRGPREAATRFLQDFLTQTVAFRRGDASILDASPELHEIAELALPTDGHWFDRLIESSNNDGESADERSYIRSLLSSPLRSAAHGARVFVMIDDVHNTSLMLGGDAFFDEIKEIYARSDIAFVLAGARRFLFGQTSGESLTLEHPGFNAAGTLAESLSVRFGVGLNDQTRDLIAVQLGGNPSQMTSLFAAAAARGEDFDSFSSVERTYTDEIFGGRTSRAFDALLAQIAPDTDRANVINLLLQTLDAADGKTPLAFWQKHLGLTDDAFRRLMGLLNIHEFVSVNSGNVHSEAANHVVSDYLCGRGRLEIAGDVRALVVGEAMTDYLKRAPQLLAQIYRRNAALGLRSLLDAFDCQEIAAAAIDYAKFKADLKGRDDGDIESSLDASAEKITLPQIVYTAHTAAFYSKIGELIEDERSTIALGFEESSYCRDETVWIAVEIDAKLEADRDLTEFWCDRLEMVAVSCGFPRYKMWLIAPEGFSDESVEILRSRNAYGSSRKQIELLMRKLTGGKIAPVESSADEYEIILPMGDDSEMIAAHAIEDIAKRHNFPAKTINQIKTALIEACINATEHSLSPDRRIYQKFAVDAEKITITVSNRGLRLMDKTAREIAPDEGRRGWGLKLIKGLMDEVKIEQTDDGTSISMTKFITR